MEVGLLQSRYLPCDVHFRSSSSRKRTTAVLPHGKQYPDMTGNRGCDRQIIREEGRIRFGGIVGYQLKI